MSIFTRQGWANLLSYAIVAVLAAATMFEVVGCCQPQPTAPAQSQKTQEQIFNFYGSGPATVLLIAGGTVSNQGVTLPWSKTLTCPPMSGQSFEAVVTGQSTGISLMIGSWVITTGSQPPGDTALTGVYP